MQKINIANLIQQLKNEKPEQESIEKEASIVERLAGTQIDEEAKRLEKIAEEVSSEVGFEVQLSKELEKVASEMEQANSVDEIIKIAKESGNEDLAHMADIADAFAGVIIAKVEDYLAKE